MWLAQGQRRPIPAQPAMLVIMRASIVNAVIAKMRRVRMNDMAAATRMYANHSTGITHNPLSRRFHQVSSLLFPEARDEQ